MRIFTHYNIEIYLRVFYALQLDDDILLLAKDDHLGRALQDMGLTNRQRVTKKGLKWNDLVHTCRQTFACVPNASRRHPERKKDSELLHLGALVFSIFSFHWVGEGAAAILPWIVIHFGAKCK